jgi:hypothetical protein
MAEVKGMDHSSNDMVTEKKVVWDWPSALEFIKWLSPRMQAAGYEVGLAGSVLLLGSSFKDLDIILFPTNTTLAHSNYVRRALLGAGLKLKMGEQEVKSMWYLKHRSRDKKKVEIWSYQDKRVDIFFLK